MLDCGFDAYQLAVVPRACRSHRGRRQKPMKNQNSEFEVLAQVARNFSGERKNRVGIGSLTHETKETKDGFVVNNFLEAMEVEVKPQPGQEIPSQVLLSKDWLALGPFMSSSPIIQEENFDSHSKNDGKRKMCYTKEPDSCSSRESQNMYPLKKRKLLYQNHRPEQRDTPCTVKFGIKSLKISELLVDINFRISHGGVTQSSGNGGGNADS
ncbi:Telomere repeat-binding protein 6 [Cardamine amara subsp. amara]|uniref:Telomere repeat-binding protein 6 n=1 Tax=Cardamine amara subsp. amara TaxID=228776 RepID=A0ABD0ZMQ1_CARAN